MLLEVDSIINAVDDVIKDAQELLGRADEGSLFNIITLQQVIKVIVLHQHVLFELIVSLHNLHASSNLVLVEEVVHLVHLLVPTVQSGLNLSVSMILPIMLVFQNGFLLFWCILSFTFM